MMNHRAALFCFTACAFAAGFCALRLWPDGEVVSRGGAGKIAPAASPHAAVPAAGDGKLPANAFLRRLDAHKRVAQLSAAEARAIMEGLRPPLTDEQRAWLTAVLRRWAESDPAAALSWLQRWTKEGTPYPEWRALVTTELARTDLHAAILALRSFGPAYDLPAALLAAAAERDPAAVMAYAEKHRQLQRHIAGAFRVWLKADPAAACAWLNRNRLSGDFPARECLALVMTYAPERLSAMLELLPEESNVRKDIREMLAMREVVRDPAAALAKFSSLPDAERHDGQYKSVIAPLAKHFAARGTPDEVAALLKKCSGEIRMTFLEKLGAGLAHGDPERTLTLARLPDLTELERAALIQNNPFLRPEHAEEFMALLKHSTWGGDEAARRFWTSNLQNRPAETMPVLQRMAVEGKVDRNLLVTITGTLISSGTAGAEVMIAALPEDLRAGPRAVLAAQAALSGSATDLTAFSGLPDAATRESALQAVFSERQGAFDSATRAAFIRQLPEAQQIEVLPAMMLTPSDAPAFLSIAADAAHRDPGGADVLRTVSMLAAQLKDFAAATQWLDTLPPGAAQDAGRLTAFMNHSRTNTIAASEWLAGQPADAPQRDTMTEVLVRHAVETDPERAWQWAATIQNAAERKQAQEEVLARWRTTNPAAAAKAAGEQP